MEGGEGRREEGRRGKGVDRMRVLLENGGMRVEGGRRVNVVA